MKIRIAQFILLVVIALACTNNDKPKVVYTQDTTAAGLIIDTTAVPMANLPIHFDSTNYLLFVVGKTQSYGRDSKFYMGSGSSDGDSFSVGYFDGESVSGDIDNIKFQHIDSIHIRDLTTEQIKIRSFHMVHATANIILLEVVDKDTNLDHKLTYEDVVSLYIANSNGTKFKKLSVDGHQLLDWELMTVADRVYFRTIEDINRNGEFDKRDAIHHYFVSLKTEDFNAVQVFPLKKQD
ncbi:MAG: hypothetical protein L3J29_00250 [Cyclobacteriaceae bacterium]|nr:hypothetical protein [Cyclobacteriaceae bacterium]